MAMAKAQAYQDAADAPSTLRAYASDVKNFEAWCACHGMTALPACEPAWKFDPVSGVIGV